MIAVANALHLLHKKYAAAYQVEQRLPTTEFVEAWSSPCYQGKADQGFIGWQAISQEPATCFSDVEKALEFTLHPSVKDFFSGYWAGDLHVKFADYKLTLLQLQLPADAERLQQNLIGHVLMKQRLGQPLTLFIGVGSEEDDLIVSVDNGTGVVGLEYVGKEQHEVLASDLAFFLEQVSPVLLD